MKLASEQFSLILGCGGFEYNNLILCSSTHNIIINFERHFDAEILAKIMDFLDFACGLFDKPIGDWNKIVNTLKMLHERFNILDDKIWEALHLWLPRHKQCGAFLRLVFNADLKNISQEEVLIEPDYLSMPVHTTIEKKKRGKRVPSFKAKI